MVKLPMDTALQQEYATMLAALDQFNPDDIPFITERQQYEQFGEEEWDLPYRYEQVDEMLEKSSHVDPYIRNMVASRDTPPYYLLPGYDELRDLSINHAIDNNYFRDLVYSECTECNQRYANYKYFKFLIENDRVPVDAYRAARIMNYPSSMRDCCTDLNVPMRTVNEEGEDVPEIPIEMQQRHSGVDRRRIALYYGMSKGRDVKWLLDTFNEPDQVVKDYQVPVLDEESRRLLDEWLEKRSPRSSVPRLTFTPYNDVKNLNHDRLCVYLRQCTSCGHPTTMAYAYYLLDRLGVSRTSLFEDFQIILPCCRMTFMSPTFKPLPYDLDEREDFYEGIGIRFRREHESVKVVQKPNQTITVRRIDRDAVAQRDNQTDLDRGVQDNVI